MVLELPPPSASIGDREFGNAPAQHQLAGAYMVRLTDTVPSLFQRITVEKGRLEAEANSYWTRLGTEQALSETPSA